MEPDNIDWDNIDSTFAHDDTYDNFDAPMWVDLSAFDDSLVDDEAWFCTHDCNHPKTAEDFLKPTTTRIAKTKLLRFASISEILPFSDRRHRRENSSIVESSYAKYSESSRRPSCSGNFYEESENTNPNFSAPLPIGKTKKLLKKTNKGNSKQMHDGPVECGVKSNKKPQLKTSFSAQNLLGGREILSQISGFCSELKRLATRGKKGTSDKGGVSEQLKESGVERSLRERVPLIVVKGFK